MKKTRCQKMIIRLAQSSLKVECRLYASQRQMLAAVRRDFIGGIENSTLACTVHQTRSTRRKKDLAATVFFSKTHITIGTVAHEMVHAADNVIDRRRRLPKDLREVRASLAGELVDGFYKQLGLK